MTDTTKYFLDTNVFWWYIVKSSRHHHATKLFLDPIINDSRNTLLVNEIVMIELFHLLVKQKGKEGMELARYLLHGDHTFFTVTFDILHVADLDAILSCLCENGMTTSIGGRDSSILHAMSRHGTRDIITHDKAFSTVEGIVVHDPVAIDCRKQ